MAQDKSQEPSEFTRIFQRQQMKAPMSERPAAQAPMEGAAQAAKPEGPGEFTRFMNSHRSQPGQASAERVPDPPPAAAPNPPPTNAPDETGDFTRFFVGGLPQKNSKPGVQRPNSPATQRPNSGEASEFTQRFATRESEPPPKPVEHKPVEYGVNNPRYGPAPDLSRQTSDSTSSFDYRPSSSRPQSSHTDERTEYTRLFGSGATPPAPRQAVVAQPQPAPMVPDAPHSLSSSRGPSEFTMVATGLHPSKASPQAGPEAEGASMASQPGTRPPLLDNNPFSANVSPVNPLSSLAGGGMPSLASSGSLGMSGGSVSTPLGSASISGPSMPSLSTPSLSLPDAQPGAATGLTPHAKLIIFFAILAILAIVLVVGLVVTQKG